MWPAILAGYMGLFGRSVRTFKKKRRNFRYLYLIELVSNAKYLNRKYKFEV